jgi:hypothetical protein
MPNQYDGRMIGSWPRKRQKGKNEVQQSTVYNVLWVESLRKDFEIFLERNS